MASKRILIEVELNDYIIFTLPIYFAELIAAIAGTVYLRNVRTKKSSTRYFVWFLWFTVVLETIGTYAPIAYFEGYDLFYFLKERVFQDNKWLYNCYSLVSASFYTYYFGTFIKSKNWKLILKILLIAFIVSSVLNLIFSDVFFEEDSKYVNLGGTFLVFFAITLFYFELLKSDRLLNLKRFLPLYVSIGVIIFYLCVTPLSIFSDYFNSENSLFVKLQVHLILFSNIFMYSFFILGFYICSRKKRSY